MVEGCLADGDLLDRTMAWAPQSQLSHYLTGRPPAILFLGFSFFICKMDLGCPLQL